MPSNGVKLEQLPSKVALEAWLAGEPGGVAVDHGGELGAGQVHQLVASLQSARGPQPRTARPGLGRPAAVQRPQHEPRLLLRPVRVAEVEFCDGEGGTVGQLAVVVTPGRVGRVAVATGRGGDADLAAVAVTLAHPVSLLQQQHSNTHRSC